MAEPVYHPSFKPSFLVPEKALLQNALLLRPFPWRTSFGAGEIIIQPLPEAPGFPSACTLTVDIDGSGWLLELDDTAVLLRHEAFTEAEGAPVFDERTLPQEVRRALLESMLTPLLASLRGCLDKPVAVLDADFQPSPSQAAFSSGFKAVVSACNGLPELTIFLRLSPLQAEHASPLTGALRALPRRVDGPLGNTLHSVPLEVTLESGYLLLKPEEVASLGPEDVLVPENWTAPDTLTLRLVRTNGSNLTAVCTVENGRVTLSSPLSEEPEPSMENPELKDIDIRLTFELDRRIITVGELELLAPGYTFALESDMSSPVTIRANGKAVARGRLVDMNGTLGVQISETL